MRPGDRVAILSENRPEWAIADYACLAARCADVPIYPTLPAKQVEYILRDSGAVAVFVSTAAQLEKVAGGPRAPARRSRTSSAFDAGAARPGVLSLRRGAGQRAARRATGIPAGRADALEATPDDLATLIYTSGTTGDPKGVMLTHGNIASNVTTCVDALQLSTTATSASRSCRSPTSSSGCSATTACSTPAW